VLFDRPKHFLVLQMNLHLLERIFLPNEMLNSFAAAQYGFQRTPKKTIVQISKTCKSKEFGGETNPGISLIL
jgi:hypothetical protein